jgi:hypothetical protein
MRALGEEQEPARINQTLNIDIVGQRPERVLYG